MRKEPAPITQKSNKKRVIVVCCLPYQTTRPVACESERTTSATNAATDADNTRNHRVCLSSTRVAPGPLCRSNSSYSEALRPEQEAHSTSARQRQESCGYLEPLH